MHTFQFLQVMFESAIIQAQKLAILTYSSFDFKTIFGVGFGLIGVIFIYHFLLLREEQGGPPLIKSWIPFVGTAFSFLRNPERFILQCRERYGNIYTLYMVGQRLHVVCDPVIGIPSIYKKDKTFSDWALRISFGTRLFGRSKDVITNLEYENAVHPIFVPFLLAQDKVDALNMEFQKNLQPILLREIEKLKHGGQFGQHGTGVKMEVLVQRVMFECSGKTMFGETWPEDEEFFNDWKAWDDGMYMMLKGYPSIFTRKIVLARERYYGRLLKMCKQPLVKPSELVLERMKVSNSCQTLL